jgi:hypothetical protein
VSKLEQLREWVLANKQNLENYREYLIQRRAIVIDSEVANYDDRQSLVMKGQIKTLSELISELK